MALSKEQQQKKDFLTKKDSYMRISIGYGYVVVPYKDGITILNALINAEEYHENYNDGDYITPLTQNKVSSTIISQDTYLKSKLKGILKASDSD